MKYKCISCETPKQFKSATGLCTPCITAKRRADLQQKYEQRIDELGYDLLVKFPFEDNKVKIQVKRRECGHQYEVQLNNLLSRASICQTCGYKDRAAKALVYWKEKYGRGTYGGKEFDDYQWHVRKLSDKTYKQNIDIINPDRHPRSRPDLNPDAWQLDHKIAIIECFKRGWTVEQAADISNLQMLPAIENLSKQRY